MLLISEGSSLSESERNEPDRVKLFSVQPSSGPSSHQVSASVGRSLSPQTVEEVPKRHDASTPVCPLALQCQEWYLLKYDTID